jgi:hypothetical protein
LPNGRRRFEDTNHAGLMNGASREWFASGALWREARYVGGHDGGVNLRHTETLVLVDGGGHIRGVYDESLAYDVTQLIPDISTRARPEWMGPCPPGPARNTVTNSTEVLVR